MTRNIHYCDTFWGEEFNSTDGFEAVNRRMKDGIDTCSAVLSIVKQRARCEEDFSKSLAKNFKSTDYSFNSEIGRLFEALESLRVNGEKVAMEHQAAVKELTDCADRIQRFVDAVKVEWRTEREKAKKIIQEKQKQYDKAMQAKRIYYEKSKTAEQAEISARFAALQSPTAVEKTVKQKEKMQQDASKAEAAYREAVNTLDEIRDQWERDLFRYFVFCEDKDKERIKMMQNEVWILTNIFSSTYVAADRCCEDTRFALEKVTPEDDIKEFIEKNQTGCKRPAAVEFERYVNTVIADGPGSSGNIARNGGPGPAMRH